MDLKTPCKYADLGAAITAELTIGFRFGVRVMLAVGVADGLNHFVREEQVQQVTTKDPNKVRPGKKSAEYNHTKRGELAQMKAQKSESEIKLTYYGAGAVTAIGVLGAIGYYVYQSKTRRRLLFTNPSKLQLTYPKKLQLINLIWNRL